MSCEIAGGKIHLLFSLYMSYFEVQIFPIIVPMWVLAPRKVTKAEREKEVEKNAVNSSHCNARGQRKHCGCGLSNTKDSTGAEMELGNTGYSRK